MESDDASLVEQARSGDVDAFARLVDRHRTDALRLAYSVAGDQADDVVQEACIKAYRALDRFRAGAPFRPWLLAIVANEARNGRRRAGRQARLALRVAHLGPTGTDAPDEVAMLLDGRRRLLAAVSALRPADREVIACRYFIGLSEAETAEALGCAPGTAKSRLSRALARLRTQLLAGDGNGTAFEGVDDGTR